MANKYIAVITGLLQEIAGLVTSTGVPDAGKIVATDATGRLDTSLMPIGVMPEVKIMTTSENLSAGNFVNIYSNAGTETARKSDASNGFTADGFVLAGTTSGTNATIYLEGINNQLTSLTIGAMNYTSATPGGATATAPTTSGYIVQQIGKTLSATELAFQPQQAITLA